MEKFLKIVGVVILAWIVLSLVGMVVGFVVHAVFWIALIAGVAWVATSIGSRRRSQIGSRR